MCMIDMTNALSHIFTYFLEMVFISLLHLDNLVHKSLPYIIPHTQPTNEYILKYKTSQ